MQYCERDRTLDEPSGSWLTWPRTLAGLTTIPEEICLKEDWTSVTRHCFDRNEWGEVEGHCVENGTDTTQDLNEILHNPEAAGNDVIGQLDHVLSSSSPTQILPYDVSLTADIIQKLADSPSSETLDVTALTRTMSTIADIDVQTLKTSQSATNATDTILANFEKCLRDFALGQDAEHFSADALVATSVDNLNPLQDHVVAFYETSRGIAKKVFHNVHDLEFGGLQFAVVLSKELLGSFDVTTTAEGSLKSVTTVYTNDALFQSESVSESNKSSNGWVPNIFLPNACFRRTALPTNFTTIFRLRSPSASAEKRCASWKFDSAGSRWSEEDVATEISGEFFSCEFGHMTHFTILIGLESDDPALNLISLIGCSLSLIGSLKVLLFALLSKSWRETDGAAIAVNLAVVNVLQMVLLLMLELFPTKTTDRTLCVGIAVCLHFAVVSQFFWLVVIGFLQYKRFVVVYYYHIKFLLARACFVGYVLPLLLVTWPPFALDGYLSGDYCYPAGKAVLFVVVVPVGASILVNLVFFVLIFRALNKNRFQTNETFLLIKLGLMLVLVLGLTWIFGFLAKYLGSTVCAYLFALSGTLQGFFTFLFFVLLNKTNRAFLKRAFEMNVVGIKFSQSFTASTSHK